MRLLRRLLLSLVLAASCGSVSSNVRAEDGFAFFESRVRPLLVKHCYECHSLQHGVVESSFNMDTREGMLRGGDRGIAIAAGKPEVSLLVKAIDYTHEDLEMPPSGRLAPDEIEVVVTWIRAGAKMPAGDVVIKPAKAIDFQEARKHWAFKELIDPHPAKSDPELVDYWIRREQRRGGLRMQKEASPAVLIRRMSLALTGLPASYEDVQWYTDAPNPSVYSSVMEGYLASPQYGERWARHWLDLVRYTDQTASWLKSTAGAWRYRDWVIAALNEDVPYDEFVKLQFAADSIQDTSGKHMAALGMLGLSPTYWKEPRLAPVVLETVIAEEWEERIDMVGRTFLGMSLACARCHDHKFDPVSQKDYYSLAGVFANTRILDVPLVAAARRKEIVAATTEIRDLNAFVQREKLARSTAVDQSVHDARIEQAEQRIDQLKNITEQTVEKVPGVVDASVSVVAESDSMSKVIYDASKMVDVAL
ncbi:MAG: DUF1549 domain-containing protein, partial [Planctomycetota bacterium]|nr:DUF1549 domain-containing protein [Planctomycetota bacterium]